MMHCFSKEMLNRFSFLSILIIVVFAINSCTKLDSTTLGGDLIPGSDRLATDTLMVPVTTTSFIENDTTIIDKTVQHVLGYVNDPMFGTTTAAMYFQMLPTIYPFSYPVGKDSLFLDSLVLSLSYNGAYGDTTASTTINAYRITDPNFKPARRYRVSESVQFSPADFLGSTTVKPTQIRRGYKLAFKGDSVFNQLRIRLDDALGTALLKESTTTGFLRNDSAFKAYLNGIALVADSTTSGSVLNYFLLNHPNSRLNLYYRYRKTDGTLDTTGTVFTFVPDTIRSASANKIHRNYNGSTAQPVLLSSSPNSLAYLQTAPGTAVTVKAPGINTVAGKNYIIHRAELVVRQVYAGPLSIENAFVQPNLHLYTVGADGKNAPIPFDSASYYIPSSFDFNRNVFAHNILETYTGGEPNFFNDASGNRVGEYRMNITRFIQNIANGKATLRDFRLAAPYFAQFRAPENFTFNVSSSVSINPISYGRLQVGGGSHPQYPMFVRIYYSKQ
ncbi:DUF4270 family protein [Lacibacter sp. MH-610]|uniref:DUF4270 family protein n=1 Tax=Lacibacter sp. MH-610 TaxID=3020883 RepID=UPI0038927D6A